MSANQKPTTKKRLPRIFAKCGFRPGGIQHNFWWVAAHDNQEVWLTYDWRPGDGWALDGSRPEWQEHKGQPAELHRTFMLLLLTGQWAHRATP